MKKSHTLTSGHFLITKTVGYVQNSLFIIQASGLEYKEQSSIYIDSHVRVFRVVGKKEKAIKQAMRNNASNEKKETRCLCFLVTFFAVLFLGSLSRAGCEMVEKDTRCNGSIAQCHEEEELFMESEISRRLLAGTDKYITYPVLGPDKTGEGGKSDQGQPYNRGCKKIFGCRENV